jgi:hypothetical protein
MGKRLGKWRPGSLKNLRETGGWNWLRTVSIGGVGNSAAELLGSATREQSFSKGQFSSKKLKRLRNLMN